MTRSRPHRHPSDGHPNPARPARAGRGRPCRPRPADPGSGDDLSPGVVRAWGPRLGGPMGVGVGLVVGLGLGVGPPAPAAASTSTSTSLTVSTAAATTRSAVAAGAAAALAPAVAAPLRDTGWQWPLQPRPTVIGRFTAPAGPYAPGRRGVDLLAVAGQQVETPGPGRVAFSGYVAGVPTVTVDHGTISTTYQPVLALVHAGGTVTAGTVIGTVATWPQLCAPRTCLRWGAYADGSTPRRYLDPLSLLGSGPVRLLPTSSGILTVPPLPAAPAAGAVAGSRSPSTPAPEAGDGAPAARPTALGLDRPPPRVAGTVAGAAATAAASPAGVPPGPGSTAGPPTAPGRAVTAVTLVAGTSTASGEVVGSAAAAAALSVRPAVVTAGDHAGLRRTIRQLGAVGLVATVLGAAGLLLPAGESALVAARLRRVRGRSSGLHRRRP